MTETSKRTDIPNQKNTRPFLKWAGNKFQIIELIRNALPPGKRLIEPFVGSASVFLNTKYENYLLCDSNADLINLYNFIKEDAEEFIRYSQYYFRGQHNTPETYYKRREIFNNTDDIWKKSALFIYLNRHCYNGLCRYNSKGGFNVPFGKYKKPYLPVNEILNFSRKSKNAIFKLQDFTTSIKKANAGDVIYCDPPYSPISNSSNFTTYSTGGFNAEQHKELANLAKQASTKGLTVIISNHATPATHQIYKEANSREEFFVRRYISCIGEQRSMVAELLATYNST